MIETAAVVARRTSTNVSDVEETKGVLQVLGHLEPLPQN